MRARHPRHRPITLDFPVSPATAIPVPDGLAEALDTQPNASYGTGALGDLLAVFSDEASLRALAPDFTALTRLARREGIRGVGDWAGTASPGCRPPPAPAWSAPPSMATVCT